jgi:phospholipid-binding lipoprotein MlaA
MGYHQLQVCTISKNKNAIIAILTAAVLLSSGCASTPKEEDQVYDPYEGVNRKIYKFNDALDRNIVKPVADAYVKVTPEPARNSITNFFANIGYFDTILNDFFQGKFKQGFADFSRFLINSTVGSLGLVDVASKVGLPSHDEDLGQTLAVYGTPQGPYLVIPFLGPNTARDAPDLAMSTVTSGLFFVSEIAVTLPLSALMFIDKRARATSALQIVDEAALDRYIFIRDAYLQHRNFLIYDGHPPTPKFEDEGNDEVPAEKPKSKDEGGETPAQTPNSEDEKNELHAQISR